MISSKITNANLVTNGPFALTGHMVKKSAILDGKKAWHPPLAMGYREQRKVKVDRLEFLCVRIYYNSFAIQYGGFCTM